MALAVDVVVISFVAWSKSTAGEESAGGDQQ